MPFTLQLLRNAVQNGDVNIDNGEYYAVLIDQHWYPVLSLHNATAAIAGYDIANTYRSITHLVKDIPYLRVKLINFIAEQPTPVDTNEILHEVRLLSESLKRLL